MMNKLLIFLLLVTLSACSISRPSLSDQGSKAYRMLKKTDKFYDYAVGYGGDTPEVVHAFQALLKESNADAAFKSLLKDATLPGQLYALCGLWFTDPAELKLHVERYRSLKTRVPTMMGCIVAEDSVSELVECKHPGTVHLRGPQDSLKEWWKRNRSDNVRYDIAGGAWPSNFKEAKP